MPRSAIAAGFVDFILSPRSIAQELATIARHPLRAQPAENRLEYRSTLDKILMLLRNQTGVDFEQYKEATIHRRLERRMVVQKTATAEQYFELLQREPAEVDALFDDCLIKVTEFFRDAAVFDALKKAVFPAIVRDRGRRDVLRVWVPVAPPAKRSTRLLFRFWNIWKPRAFLFPYRCSALMPATARRKGPDRNLQ